ncbi:MAG: hypothetical protein Q8O67_07470 [Deltaproteobacteria bacterium]|nr:hypothetical protein [Deltaproteobacteria bacterium]
MIEGLLALSFSLTAQAATVTVSKDVVDAQGVQEVVVKVSKASMVHLAVQSEVGVACTVIDHLRGPFFDNGVAGKTNCNADVMLDQGLYKLRLVAPTAVATTKKTAAPRAKVIVTPFVDVDAPLVLLPGRSSTAQLPPGKQITRWLRVPSQQEIVVDVYGRTAGELELWRDGQWVMDALPRKDIDRPVVGRPIHHQRLTTVVDPGDYTVVVYGTNPQTFSAGTDDNTVFVGYDAAPASTSRSEIFTLPAWGALSVRVPVGNIAAFLSLDTGKRADTVTMKAEAVFVDDKIGLKRGTTYVSCAIQPTATVAGCTLQSGSSSSSSRATILEVKGPPGTSGRIVWAPLASRDNSAFGDARSDVVVDFAAGVTDVAVTGLPTSIDQPPLSCSLERLDPKGNFVTTVARDLPSVGLTQAWKRRFNSDATSLAVWLSVDRPGLYGITGDEKLGASCEVFRLEDNGAKIRVGEGSDGKCNHKVALPAGPIEVRFYGGKPGIQELRVGQVGLAALVGTDEEAPMRAGCSFTGLTLAAGRYRVRTNDDAGATLRGVFGFGDGLTNGTAVVVAVDPRRTLRVALAPGASVQAKNTGPGAFSCALDGKPLSSCETGPLTSAATLTLDNPGTRPALALVARVTPPLPEPSLDPFKGSPPRLPVVADGKTVWFDLDGTTSKSFLVDVDKAGLFDLATEGLLSTRCSVRTAVSSKLFSGDQNGRGRNCLVESYLKPGRYLVEVTANARSKGRAGLRLTAKPAWAGGDLGLGDERFVSVAAGALARHGFTLKKDTEIDWGVKAQGAELLCRLDDNDGWPTRKVPHSCDGQEVLKAGSYTLSVLPLTVESRRALRLGEPKEQPVLTGDKTHALALNSPYQAELGDDGKDSFRFTLTSDVDVGITLGNAMQGRLYASDDKGKKGEVVTAIAPIGGGAFSLATTSSDEEEEGEVDTGEEQHNEEYGEYSEGEGEEGEGEEGEGEESESSRGDAGRAASALLQATVHRTLPALAGQIVSLKAGTWLLETEHSRGDVGVAYPVMVGVRALLPGVNLKTTAPVVVDVKAPVSGAAGLVRIKTRGETDVACRLLDGRGTLVASSQQSGADWNCALAVPLVAGTDYRLYVDAEVLRPGPTEVSAQFLEAKDTGALKDNDSFKLVGRVAKSSLVPKKGKVMDVTMTASEDFSCAAFDVDGALLDRHVGVRTCSLLLWGNEDERPFSVLTWTADRPATVKVQLSERGTSSGGLFGGGDLGDDVVKTASISARGRFATADNALCLPRKQRGALLPCAGAASFDPKIDGDTVLVGVARGTRASVSFKELIANLDKPTTESRVLEARKTVERQQSARAALHLVDVQSLPGSAANPACHIDGGTHSVDAARCTASSGLTKESALSTWTRPGGSLPVRLSQRAVTPPAAVPVVAGTSVVTGSVRFALPDDPFRLDLAVPADAWVVLLDASDRAIDLCAPAKDLKPLAKVALARCVLRGRGGSVVVAGAGASASFEVRADAMRFAAFDDAARLLSGLFELKPRGPGRERLRFASSTTPRSLRIEGSGVSACAIHTDDGARIAGCRAVLPANVGGDVVVEHDGGNLRATLGPVGDLYANRYGTLTAPSSSSSLTPGKAEVLGGAVLERTATTPTRGVLRMRSTSGVCAVVDQGPGERGRVLQSEGLGGGCDLRVVVDKGQHRLLVRGFGGASLGGTLTWSFEPVTALVEGVNKETLIQAGEARVFEVALLSDGQLGVGLKVDAEVLDCALLNTRQEVVADGCQIFGRFTKGTWYLRVEAPPDSGPRRFSPVIFGLKGADVDVPDVYLRDFFTRVPRPKESAQNTKEVH